MSELSSDVFTFVDRGKPQLINGLDILRKQRSNKAKYSTGCENFDDLLDGEIKNGEIYEFYGSESSTVSDLCLSILANTVAADERCTVLYIHTGRGFSFDRLLQLFDRHLKEGEMDSQCLNRTLESWLLRFRVLEVFRWCDLMSNLDSILRYTCTKEKKSSNTAPSRGGGEPTTTVTPLSQNSDLGASIGTSLSQFNPSCTKPSFFHILQEEMALQELHLSQIVIDSPSPLLGAFVGNVFLDVLQMTWRFLRLLAKRCSLSIISTSHTITGQRFMASTPSPTAPLYILFNEIRYPIKPLEIYKAALGRSWRNAFHHKIQVEELHTLIHTTENTRNLSKILRLSVVKSTRKPIGEYCFSLLTSKGASQYNVMQNSESALIPLP